MQSASSNGPCLLWMAIILSKSRAIEPIAEPVTSLRSINNSKKVRYVQSSYILRAGGVDVMAKHSARIGAFTRLFGAGRVADLITSKIFYSGP
jgi:hypothetical protein